MYKRKRQNKEMLPEGARRSDKELCLLSGEAVLTRSEFHHTHCKLEEKTAVKFAISVSVCVCGGVSWGFLKEYKDFSLVACCSLKLAPCISCFHFLILHNNLSLGSQDDGLHFHQRLRFFVLRSNTGQISGFPAPSHTKQAEYVFYRKLSLMKFRLGALRVDFHCGSS